MQAPEALHSHPSGLETPPRSAPVQSPSGGRTRSGSFRDHTKSSLLRQAVTASEFPNATPEDGAALGARSRSRSNSQLSSNSASSAVAPSTQRASLSVSQLDEVSYRQDLAATMQNGVWHEESPWLQRHHPASAMWGSEVNSSSSAGPALIDPFEETVLLGVSRACLMVDWVLNTGESQCTTIFCSVSMRWPLWSCGWIA